MGVLANLGAKINIRKRAVRIDPNVVEDVSTEWGNKRNWVSFKVGDMGDEAKGIAFNEFFLGNPKLFSAVVNNGVLVGVLVDGKCTSGSGEEVRKKVSYQGLFI